MSPNDIDTVKMAATVISTLMLNIIASTPMTVATEVMSCEMLWFSDWLIRSTSLVIRERTSPWVVVS